MSFIRAMALAASSLSVFQAAWAQEACVPRDLNCGPQGQAFKAAVATYSVLKNFFAPEGAGLEYELIKASDGNLYGTTDIGGAANGGTVFRLTTAGVLTTLHSFAGNPEGRYPAGSLVQGSDGNFYGVTLSGGANGTGSAYSLTPAGTLTTLYSFSAADGKPTAGLVQGTDGNFYGTTANGGSAKSGIAFKLTPAGVLTVLHEFAGNTEGSHPNSSLVRAANGDLFGTTLYGGDNCGTVFKVSPSGAFTQLHAFKSDESEGCIPSGLTLAADGSFLGTTESGGTASSGTIFRITATGTLSSLHSFAGGSGGNGPLGRLVLASDGNFYGTTGETGAPTIFRITPSGTFTTITPSFSNDAVWAGLVQGGDGALYGVTYPYCCSSSASIFRVTTSGALTILKSLPAQADGDAPRSPLVLASDGNFYGATTQFGPNGWGGIFRVTPAGTFTLLHAFTPTEVSGVAGALIQGTDGNFYGTGQYGGASNYGGIFRITPTGAMTTLHEFSRTDGATPIGSLIQLPDGNFYGTTSKGGTSSGPGPGTVFKMTPSGALTTLYTFNAGGPDGFYPRAGLTLGRDGNLYGTTSQGGANFHGTVFRMTSAGALTTLYTLGADQGGYTRGLTLGRDGDFYGVASETDTTNFKAGVVFKVTPAGAFTVLHRFTGGADGDVPYGPLVQAGDGNFYGTVVGEGVAGSGLVYQITPSGTITTLYSFGGGSDGGQSRAGLVIGADKAFYGTTVLGTVFRLAIDGSDGATGGGSGGGTSVTDSGPPASGGGAFGDATLWPLALAELARRLRRRRMPVDKPGIAL